MVNFIPPIFLFQCNVELICMSERIGIFLYQKWMTQNMISKFPNKTTKLCTDQRVISLYFKVFSAFYVIYYTLTIAVNYKPTFIFFLENTSLWSQMDEIFFKTKFGMCHPLPGSSTDTLLFLSNKFVLVFNMTYWACWVTQDFSGKD